MINSDRACFLTSTEVRELIKSVKRSDDLNYKIELLIEIGDKSTNNLLHDNILAKTVTSCVKVDKRDRRYIDSILDTFNKVDNKYSSMSFNDIALDMYYICPDELKFPLLYYKSTGDVSVLDRYRGADLMINLMYNIVSGNRYDSMGKYEQINAITEKLDTVTKKSLFLYYLKREYEDIFSLIVITKGIPEAYYLVSNLDILSINKREFTEAIKRCVELAIESVKDKHHRYPILEILSEDIVFNGESYTLDKSIYNFVFSLWKSIDEDTESLSVISKMKLAVRELTDYTRLIKNIKKIL